MLHNLILLHQECLPWSINTTHTNTLVFFIPLLFSVEQAIFLDICQHCWLFITYVLAKTEFYGGSLNSYFNSVILEASWYINSLLCAHFLGFSCEKTHKETYCGEVQIMRKNMKSGRTAHQWRHRKVYRCTYFNKSQEKNHSNLALTLEDSKR